MWSWCYHSEFVARIFCLVCIICSIRIVCVLVTCAVWIVCILLLLFFFVNKDRSFAVGSRPAL